MLRAVVWVVVCCGACGGQHDPVAWCSVIHIEWHVAWFNLFYVRERCVKSTTRKHFNNMQFFLIIRTFSRPKMPPKIEAIFLCV